MLYAVVSDVTPTRCTVHAIHDDEQSALDAAERLDTGINGMPAQVMTCADDVGPGRARHDGGVCYPA